MPERVLRATASSELVAAVAPDGERVVLKIARGRYAERLVVEHAILGDLEHVDGVSRALGLEVDGADTVLILEALGEADLRDRIDTLDLSTTLDYAAQLARVLRDVHAAGVVHRDVKPANIVVTPDGAVQLIDFGLSASPSRAPRTRRFEGTLAYMAPEQTGRLDCDVDARADLYAFGVTLFEMLTGRLPFELDSPLDYIQAHLAAEPPRVDALAPAVPRIVADLVDRLLRKDRERRYQTAVGVLADLERLVEALRRGEPLAPFTLGRGDRRRLPPGRLWGRDALVERLAGAILGDGPRLQLLIGEAGLGKSAVVDAARAAVLARGGLVLDGKFEQYRAARPYSVFAEALDRLADRLLGLPDASLAAWREALDRTLGALTGVIVDLAPRFGAVLISTEPLATARPEAARNRLGLAMQRLVEAAAEQVAGPLLLTIDDLQWADDGSLWLIGALLDTTELAVLAAARPAAAPPWTALLDARAAAAEPAHVEALGPLGDDDIVALVADLTGRSIAEADALARLTADRARNSPLLARQFLAFLVESGRLTPHPEGGWRWRMDDVLAAGLPDDLAATLTARLDRLPPELLDVLGAAACVGTAFEPHLVFDLLSLPRPAFDAALGALRDQGLLTADAQSWRFAHDRIHEAARRRLDPATRAALHRRIGQHLLEHAGDDGPADGQIFVVVDHLNAGHPPDHPAALARLNLTAGRRATDRGAWQAAASYLQSGLDLLATLPDAHPDRERLAFDLELERAQAALLVGEQADADARFEALLAVTTEPRRRARVVFRRVVSLTAGDHMERALEVGLPALAEQGVPLVRHPSGLRAMWSALRAWWITRPSRHPRWQALPPVEEPGAVELLRLMATLNGSAYAIDKRLLIDLLSRNVLELARRGRSPWIGIILGNFALILIGAGRHADGLALIDLALANASDLPTGPATRLEYIAWMFARPWHRPFRDSIAPMRRAATRAYEAGDVEYGLLLSTGLHALQFFAAGHLGQLEADLAESRALLAPYTTGARLMVQSQMQRAVGQLTGTVDYDPVETACGHVPGDRPNLLERRLVFAMPLLCVFGDFEQAVLAAERLPRPRRRRFFALALGPIFAFYEAFARLCLGASPRKVRKIRRQLHRSAERCPANFAAAALALDAECARRRGDVEATRIGYRVAVDAAQRHADRMLQGIIEERWADLEDRGGFADEAALHRARARAIYAAWGADAKVAALDAAHPVLDRIGERAPFTSLASTTSLRDVDRDLDLATVWTVARELSGDLRLGTVVRVVLDAALHNAGATAGLLALTEPDGALRLVGRRAVGEPHTPLDTPLADAADAPRALIRFVARTGEPVVLARADAGRFDDPTLTERPALAVLCVPLATNDGDVGVLYLENDRVGGAFTRDRIRILRLIGMQAALSLANARLHQATEQLAQTLEERVAERTAELAVARDAALEAARAKSAFLAAMSHEIRTPMNGLIGTAQLLAGTRLDEQQRDYVDIIGGSADSLLTVLNDILDFSKIEAGRFEIEERPFSLRETVDAVAQLIADLAARKAIDLTVHCDAAVRDRVVGDAGRLRQVLLNLTGNAIKFTEAGRVDVHVTAPDDSRIRFDVRDTGIGIDPDQLVHLFQPFAQADHSISRRFGGTGLGLAICKRLVELMGGRIGVKSSLGAGSTFWFELPLPQDPSRAPEPAAVEAPAPPDARPANVLVVEDNPINQKITRWMLERHGYTCEVVDNGRRALDTEATGDFDLILMDCQMPEMDGLEATRRLRARGCTLPIIALTAGALADERAACRAAGMDDFVPKPIKIPELVGTLAKHLGARSPS